MIAIIIFHLHIIGAVYAFSKTYVEQKLGDAFVTVAFVGIIFSVGWTFAGFVVRFVFPETGLGPWLDNDTISLLLVTLFEAILYGGYFWNRRKKRPAISTG